MVEYNRSRAQAYAAELDKLTRMSEALSPEVRRRILALLEDLDREILADLARTPAGSYKAGMLQALKAEVERNLQQFSQQASAVVNQLQSAAWQQTAAQVDSTVHAATGGVAIHPIIDEAMLRVAQGYTADLISGLSAEASAKINRAIQRAALGCLTLQQLAEQIGTILEGGTFSGLFSAIGEQAMTIATNEVGRMQSLATMARIDDLATRHKGLMKRWLHLPVSNHPRPTHIAADKQVQKPKEPFLVGGEELQYPRDPRGSLENTIDCHCLVQPYFP